jgi:hypothetical protein
MFKKLVTVPKNLKVANYSAPPLGGGNWHYNYVGSRLAERLIKSDELP